MDAGMRAAKIANSWAMVALAVTWMSTGVKSSAPGEGNEGCDERKQQGMGGKEDWLGSNVSQFTASLH